MKKQQLKQEPNHMLQNTLDNTRCNVDDGSCSDNYQKRAIFYSTVTLWDILIDSSNVMDESDGDENLSLNQKTLTSIICNIDGLISKFKAFIAEVCSDIKEVDANKQEGSTLQDKETKEDVYLSETLAMLLKCGSTNISITNSSKLGSELERCTVIVDSFLQSLIIDDGGKISKEFPPIYSQNESQDKYDNVFGELGDLPLKHEDGADLSSNLNIWEKGDTGQFSEMVDADISLNAEERQTNPVIDTNEAAEEFHNIRKPKKKFHKAGRPKGSKMKPSNSVVGRFRRLGYYPDYCVSEDVYKEAIEMGSPYACPLCQKMYKERRSLEKHFAGTVNNKCPGVPVEKPTYILDNGRYYCTQSGCDHEVATHGAKSMGVIWTHHQSEHLSKDANLPFNCDQCPKAFPLHSILASHIASTHELKKCSQICDVCGKTIAGSKNKIKQQV